MKYGHTLQHGCVLKTLSWVKEASHKGPHIIYFVHIKIQSSEQGKENILGKRVNNFTA